MKKKFVLLSTIAVLMMGQSSVGFAVTNETPNVAVEKTTQSVEVTQANEENEEQQVNNQQEAATEQEEQANTSKVKDEKAPTLHSLKVDNKEVSSGESVKISADVQDESGVKYVSVLYRSVEVDKEQKNTDTRELNLEYNAENKAYEGKFVVSGDTTAGTWDVDTISVGDNLGNETTISRQGIENKDVSFVVKKDSKGDKSDVTPPTIGEVIVDKKADPLGVGDIINFSVEATDDQSEFLQVYILCYKPNGTLGPRIDLTYNETTKRYEGSFEIKEYTEIGVWKDFELRVWDKAGNYTFQQLIESITVVGTTLDKVAPVIEDVNIIADKEVINGETVKVNAKITDDFSGVDVDRPVVAFFINKKALERMVGHDIPNENRPEYGPDYDSIDDYHLAREFPELCQYVNLDSIYGSDLFEGMLTVTEEMERGEWSLVSVYTTDKAENKSGETFDYGEVSFAIVDKTTPTTPEQPEQPTKPEQPASPEQPTKPEQPAKPEQPTTQSPQTGDTSNVSLYGAALLVSALGLGVLVRRKKRY